MNNYFIFSLPRSLEVLDLSHNCLTSLDPAVTRLSGLTSLSLAHNKLTAISVSFAALSRLTHLDLSHNQLRLLPASVLPPASLPGLASLDLTSNPWACDPSLAWLLAWSDQLTPELQCRIPDSPQEAPLLPVMREYRAQVTPHCPPACSCHFYHFVPRHSEPPAPAFSFTVSVNCSGSGLAQFPVLPRHTVRLDMSHNNIQSEVTIMPNLKCFNEQLLFRPFSPSTLRRAITKRSPL